MKKATKPKAKTKAAKKKNGAAAPKPDTVASKFGIREGGERAAVLEALYKPIGKKHTAKELAKLTDTKSTTAVARIVSRIEKKSAKYKLGYKVLREKTDEGHVYALQHK